MRKADLAAEIRSSLTHSTNPHAAALLAVVDWCEEQREHGGTLGIDDADEVEGLIARELGVSTD